MFLTSSLGWQFDSIRDRSQRQLKPCNLFAALRWGLEQAAQIVHSTHSQVLDELNQELEERRTYPYSWIWSLTDSRSLDTMLKATDRDYQLTKGPYAGRFTAICRTIQRTRSNQMRGLVASCIGVVLMALLACWNQFRGGQIAVYDEYDRLVGEADPDAVVKERLAYYRTRIATRKWDWLWLVRDRRDSADAQALKDGEWEAISTLPISTATDCETKCQRFHDYLIRPDALCREEVAALLQTTSKKWYYLLAALPTATRKDVENKSHQLEAYATGKDAVCRREARQWLDVVSQGTKYLDEKLGERKLGQDYWELSTGLSLNLNPMFAFIEDKWQVRWRKSVPWSKPEDVIPPWGKGEIATKEILNELTELNKMSPTP